MLIREICFVSPLEDVRDIEDYNIDVLVELETGYTYTVVERLEREYLISLDFF